MAGLPVAGHVSCVKFCPRGGIAVAYSLYQICVKWLVLLSDCCVANGCLGSEIYWSFPDFYLLV
jgi:hypothetical protein